MVVINCDINEYNYYFILVTNKNGEMCVISNVFLKEYKMLYYITRLITVKN